MRRNIVADDLKTKGIVLRRTNYGEADRILNIITPVGKISAIAKGVRRPKSKLAGGVEMFTLSDLQIHRGRSELGIVTSAKMLQHYDQILKNYDRMQLAGLILKKISTAAEHSASPDFYEITRQCLHEINNETNVTLVESWFWLNLLKASGEEVNLYRDVSGAPLSKTAHYDWDILERAFSLNPQGDYGENEIKMLRLMTKMDLAVVKKIKIEPDTSSKVYDIIKLWEN